MTNYKSFLSRELKVKNELNEENESTVSGDIAGASGNMQGKKELYKKCMNKEEECTKDIDDDTLGESPIGQIGRTSDTEAEDYINGNDHLKSEFKAIIRKIGGVAVARRLLNSKLFGSEVRGGVNESPVGQIGRTGYKDAESHLEQNPDLIKRFKKIIKELGGLTATRKLLLQMGGLGQLAGGISGIGPAPKGSIQESNTIKYFNDMYSNYMKLIYELKQIDRKTAKKIDDEQYKIFEKIQDLLDANDMHENYKKGDYAVFIDDKRKGKDQQYSLPMDKQSAENMASKLKKQMETSIPEYQFATNIRVERIKK